MSKRVAIVQSNYVPWKGYLDLIGLVDEFVLLDDAQYTRRDWRNRNRIKTAQGVQWLTVPVKVRGRYEQRIDETEISEPGWAEKHWSTLRHAYGRAPHFATYADAVREAYEAAAKMPLLSQVNRHFLELLTEQLGITTPLRWSTELAEKSAPKTGALVALCVAAGATEYLSGPAARDYLDEDQFAAEGISVSWMDYGGYPEYEQPHPPFDHFVSALDLLFSAGPGAPRLMKCSCPRR